MKFLFLAVLMFSSLSLAQDNSLKCTKAPREAWIKADMMKKKIENKGYTIKKFTTLEYCYLAEVTDRAGKAHEFYFNPESGNVVTLPK